MLRLQFRARSMTFQRATSGKLQITAAALEVLNSYRQHSGSAPESGGLLLGRLIEDNTDVVIDEATPPDTEDQRGRFFFVRHARPAQRRVVTVWKESGSTRNYLGEWHSHPEDDPCASTHDLLDWARIMKESKFEQDCLFFAIVGRKSLRVWEFRVGERAPRLLKETKKV